MNGMQKWHSENSKSKSPEVTRHLLLLLEINHPINVRLYHWVIEKASVAEENQSIQPMDERISWIIKPTWVTLGDARRSSVTLSCPNHSKAMEHWGPEKNHPHKALPKQIPWTIKYFYPLWFGLFVPQHKIIETRYKEPDYMARERKLKMVLIKNTCVAWAMIFHKETSRVLRCGETSREQRSRDWLSVGIWTIDTLHI